MTRRDKLLAHAQLLRLPNVFTAFADIALGACAAGYLLERPGVFALLLAASGCLYLAGMAFNDLADRREDARSRPFRPLPSGRVSARAALLVGVLLWNAGLVSAAATRLALPDPEPGHFLPVHAAVLIGLAVLLYDFVLKPTVLAPLGMGLCRFLNVLLGLSAGGVALEPVGLHLAAVVGLYIVGVTWFARTEEGESQKSHLLAASGVMLAALGLALAVPTHFAQNNWSVSFFPYLLVAFGFWVGSPVAAAIREPSPKRVQAAVKACVLGLVLLDAVLATAFVGPAGLLVGLLLVPARYLGRWVYST